DAAGIVVVIAMAVTVLDHMNAVQEEEDSDDG
nr:hypothetical protein [Tanacetum cinerariifolium]